MITRSTSRKRRCSVSGSPGPSGNPSKASRSGISPNHPQKKDPGCDDSADANGESLTGSGGVKSNQHGVTYQLKWLMLFALIGWKKKLQFHLGTEVKYKGKFDDLVITYEHPKTKEICKRYVQIKHIQQPQKDNNIVQITHTKLTSGNDKEKFSLQKYFKSFCDMTKESVAGANFYICTNIGFDFEQSQITGNGEPKIKSANCSWYFEPAHTTTTPDDFFNVGGHCYKFKMTTPGSTVVEDLMAEFEKTSDSKELAGVLAAAVINKESLKMTNPLVKQYVAVLKSHVVDVQSGKFQSKFLLNKWKVEECPGIGGFRKYFREAVQNLSEELAAQIDESKFWAALKIFNLPMTKGFVKNVSQVGDTTVSPSFPLPVSVESVESFLNQLIFAVDQPNEEELYVIISKEFQEILNLADPDFCTSNYLNTFLDWMKAKECSSLQNQDVAKIFKEIEEKLAQNIVIGLTKGYTTQLTKTGIKFKREAPPSEGCFFQLFLQVFELFLTKKRRNPIFNLIFKDDTPIILGSLMVHQCLDELEAYRSEGAFIFVQLDTLLRLNIPIVQAFSAKTTKLLVIECGVKKDGLKKEEKEKLAADLKMFFNERNDKKVVLIRHCNEGTFDCLSDSLLLQDLLATNIDYAHMIPESQEHLLSQKINFQGHLVTLSDVVGGSKNHDLLKNVPLSNLIGQEKFIVGEALPNLSQKKNAYHVERTFECTKEYLGPSPKMEDVACALSQDKSVIMSDGPGMGKSTTLTKFATLIKNTDPTLWVTMVKLADYSSAFADHLNSSSEQLTTGPGAIKFLASRILKLSDGFVKNLFAYRLNKAGKIVLLFDAFDEISPHYKEIVLSLFKSLLKETKLTQLWVTTRPEQEKTLTSGLESPIPLKLVPLKEEEQISIMAKYWTAHHHHHGPCQIGKDHGDNLDQELVDAFAKKLITKMTFSIYDWELKFTSTPLIQIMLAKGFRKRLIDLHDEYRKTGRTIFRRLDNEHIDLKSVYDEFFEYCFQNFVKKAKIEKKVVLARDLLQNCNPKELMQVSLERLAIKQLNIQWTSMAGGHQIKLPFDSSLEDAFKLLPMAKRMSIIDRRDGGHKFIHKTYAEYFVAEYLARNLEQYKEQVEHILAHDLVQNDYRLIRSFFLSNKAILKPGNYLRQLMQHGWFEKIISAWPRDSLIEAKDRWGRNFLHYAAQKGTFHIFEMLYDNDGRIRELMEATDNFGRNPLFYAVNAVCALDHILKIMAKVEERNLEDNIFKNGVPSPSTGSRPTCLFDSKNHKKFPSFFLLQQKDIFEKSVLDYTVTNGRRKGCAFWSEPAQLIAYGADCTNLTPEDINGILDHVRNTKEKPYRIKGVKELLERLLASSSSLGGIESKFPL